MLEDKSSIELFTLLMDVLYILRSRLTVSNEEALDLAEKYKTLKELGLI